MTNSGLGGGTFGGFQFVNETDNPQEAKLAPDSTLSIEAKYNDNAWIPKGQTGSWQNSPSTPGTLNQGSTWDVYSTTDGQSWMKRTCTFTNNVSAVKFTAPSSGDPTVQGNYNGAWINGAVGTAVGATPPPNMH